MASVASEMMSRYAGQLAEAAEHVMNQIPETTEWEPLRYFCRNVCGLLRNGDFRAGFRAFIRVMPYVQRALCSVEKLASVEDTYEITQNVQQHFLVDETAREQLEKVMDIVKVKMNMLREKVEQFAQKLDKILEDVVLAGTDISLLVTLKLAFQMNRISSLVYACDDNLHKAREMIDSLDTHLAGKSFLASLFSVAAFLTGLAFSATGNLPIGGACFAAASAGRQSAQKLDDYRAELNKIEDEHRRLQLELQDWRHRFRAEQRNFLLLIGLQRVAIFLLLLGVAFLFLGKAVNYFVFAAIFMYFAVRSEETNGFKYYAAIFLGVVAMVMEIEKQKGMVLFNTAGCVTIIATYLGFVDV